MQNMIAFLIAAFGLFLAVDDSKQAQIKQELAKLQGIWLMVEAENNGETFKYTEGSQPKWVINGNKLVSPNGKEVAELTIDPSATPKTLDLRPVKLKRPFEAIYVLEDGTWKMCISRTTEGVRERPSEFSTKNRSEWTIQILKREKP